MKRIVLAFIVCFTTAAFPQTWDPLTGPYGNRVYAVIEASNGNLIVATADHLWVLDNGSWSKATLVGSINNLTFAPNSFKPMIKTPDGNFLYADLQMLSGKLWRSADSGVTWNEVATSGIPQEAVNSFALDTAGNLLAGSNRAPGESSGGGIWKSIDNGSSWTPIGIDTIAVRCIAVRNDGYIFAGTTQGIWKSTNHGASWTEVNAGLTNTNVISLLLADGHIFAGTEGNGVFRSTDNGGNWVSLALNTHYIHSLARVGSTIFAASFTDNGGIFKSTDNGLTWNASNTGLQSDVSGGLDIPMLYVNDSGILFSGTSFDGIYKSTDSGANWNQIGIPMNIKATATNGSYIFASAEAWLFKSTNNGSTWKRIAMDVTDDAQTLVFKSDTLLVGTPNNGIRKSADNGSSWTSANYPRSNVETIATHPNGTIYAGGPAFGIYKSTDNGTSWQWADNGLTKTVFSIAISSTPGSYGYIYAGTSGSSFQNPSGVFRSTDNGANWDSIGLGTYTVTAISLDSDGNVFAGTYDGVYKSTNNGASWILSGENIPSKTLHRPTDKPAVNPTNVISLFSANTATIFAGTEGNGFFRSPDKGETWLNASNGLPDPKIGAIAADTNGYLLLGTGNGFWKSAEKISDMIPPLASVLSSPENNATDIGLAPILEWFGTATALSYRLQISTDSLFGTTLIDLDGITGTAQEVDVLKGYTTYFWRVKASNEWGPGPWGTVWRFTTTAEPPGLPILLLPSNNATHIPLQATLMWKNGGGATSYHLQVATDPAFGSGIIVNDSTLEDTTRLVPYLLHETDYYWRVKAKNEGGESGWSGTSMFTTAPFSLNLTFMPGWNMVSMPLNILDARKISVFPEATSPAFMYDGSYQTAETLKIGKGYWLKFNGDILVTVEGLELEEDTVEVNMGWNMVGSLSEPFRTETIESNPPGLITSPFFGYTDTGYGVTDTIHVGKGYWVKAMAKGKLIFKTTGGMLERRIKQILVDETPPPPPETPRYISSEVPKAFVLYENYPNPFNPKTMIAFDLPHRSEVTLTVYNTVGQTIATLLDRRVLEAGRYDIPFDAENLSSGMYFYRFETSGFVRTKKMILMK